jgi:hypothetical protein
MRVGSRLMLGTGGTSEKRMKRCSVCKEHKAREEFNRHVRRKDGLRSACKECEKTTYKKQPRDKERDKGWEAKEREALTDRVIKQRIWRETKGTVKWNEMNQEMIESRRKEIREGRDKLKARINGSYAGEYCLIHLVKCDVCGRWLSSRWSTAKQCSDECRYEKQKERLRLVYKENWEQPEPFECKECGKLHRPEYGDKKSSFCSKRCANKSTKRAYKKRAEENGVHFEYVSPTRVFTRDGWHCQLCGKKLNPKHRGSYRDDAPELDHIIPWAQGGEHSYRNTQCACRKCNSYKNAKEMGQLRLFG